MQRVEMIGKILEHLQAKCLCLPGNARLMQLERLVQERPRGLAMLFPGTVSLKSAQPCGFVHG